MQRKQVIAYVFCTALKHNFVSFYFHADIAIGAPYEVNGDSTGVVYIYYGSSNFTAFQQQTPFKVCYSYNLCV